MLNLHGLFHDQSKFKLHRDHELHILDNEER